VCRIGAPHGQNFSHWLEMKSHVIAACDGASMSTTRCFGCGAVHAQRARQLRRARAAQLTSRSVVVLGSLFVVHCSSVDDRQPDVVTGAEQPAPGSGGASSSTPAAGAATVTGMRPSEGAAAAGTGAAPELSSPEVPLEPIARGAECDIEQSCDGAFVCGISATPDQGTGRVCCDQECGGVCQGCSIGTGICGPVGDNVPCTASGARPGACAEPGACTEYCAAGVSRAGFCLVQPG
jgi:hypothetical protein